ncbi:MAG: hypothetical protein GWP08_11720 [Nitrospiraceae bacterium]|nr:hypothetical protein [Nitrospiraceae bacterium]
MGTLPLQSLQQLLLADSFSQVQAFNMASSRGPKAGAAKPATEPDPVAGKEVQAGEHLAASMYYAEMQRVAMAFEFQQASGGQGDDGAGEGTQESQLTFSFFAESRAEELVSFQQRTNAVAKGLEGATQETYVEASRKVSARFEMSMTLSGQALNGFAKASEAEQAGAGDMDKFLGFARDVLDNADDIVNKMFALLDGFFSGGANFQTAFDELINEIYASGLLSGPAGATAADAAQAPQAPYPANASQAQATSFNIQMEFSFEFSAEITIEGAAVKEADPVMFDLDGDGFELSNYRNGAKFDLLGNGSKVQTAFVTGGDAFLALDRNGNGIIDNGKELFGEQHGAANGFAELAKLDDNGDGVINAKDASFDKLVLFRDNGNGKTDPGELLSLKDAGIAEIRLGYKNVSQTAAGGNRIAQISSFLRTDGSVGRTADAMLNYMA